MRWHTRVANNLQESCHLVQPAVQDYPWGQTGGINAGVILLQPDMDVYQQMQSEASAGRKEPSRPDMREATSQNRPERSYVPSLSTSTFPRIDTDKRRSKPF